MPAAAEASRELIDVHVARAPKGNLHFAVAKIAKEDRHARAGDRSRMLDDAVEVFRAHTMPLERTRSHRQPRNPTLLVHAQAPQHFREQTNTPGRRRGVDALIHLLRIDASGEQITGDRVTPRRGVAVAKRSRVGENRRVQRARDLRRDRQVELAREVVDQLSRRARRGVGEHDVSGRIVRRHMVIDDDRGNR